MDLKWYQHLWLKFKMWLQRRYPYQKILRTIEVKRGFLKHCTSVIPTLLPCCSFPSPLTPVSLWQLSCRLLHFLSLDHCELFRDLRHWAVLLHQTPLSWLL